MPKEKDEVLEKEIDELNLKKKPSKLDKLPIEEIAKAIKSIYRDKK